MQMPLALSILLHNPRQFAVSMAGVLLAVVLMFSQVGFWNALFDSQTALIQHLNGDLMIINKQTRILYVAEPFSTRRLHQARASPGVAAVAPLYFEGYQAVWKNPQDGSTRPLRVLAFDPDDEVLDLPGLDAYAAALKKDCTALFDSESRNYYGRPAAGTATELSGRRVEVVGTFRLGTDFLTDGNLIMSHRNFQKFFPDRTSSAPLDKVMVGVVRLEPGSDVRVAQAALRERLPEDVLVLTKQELVEHETKYWRENTAIGYTLGLGMTVGLGIGIVICYQILYTKVGNYLPQFATLKAMGYSDWYLVSVVMQQGLFLAVLGFLPAVAAAQVLFWVVSGLTGLLMFFTIPRLAEIFLLTVVMCMVSAAVAVRRVLKADPAEVFR